MTAAPVIKYVRMEIVCVEQVIIWTELVPVRLVSTGEYQILGLKLGQEQSLIIVDEETLIF